MNTKYRQPVIFNTDALPIHSVTGSKKTAEHGIKSNASERSTSKKNENNKRTGAKLSNTNQVGSILYVGYF